MSALRYVAVCTRGYFIPDGPPRRPGAAKEGESWVVLDSASCYREVTRVWRSDETTTGTMGSGTARARHLGPLARALAEAAAAELNALEATRERGR